MSRAGKFVAAGGVFGTLIAAVIGTWYALTRDVHTLKEIPPDALPQAPAMGKTGYKRIDAILGKLQSAASSSGIPLGLMVGWIAKESGGKLSDTTSLGEKGLFQSMASEDQAIGVDHDRVSTDLDYSIDAGVKLIRHYQSAVNDLNLASAPAGSSFYWRLVKLGHSVGSGQLRKIVSAAKTAGQVGSWDQLEQFALGISVMGPQPKKWFPFIDLVYQIGRPFGFGSDISAPALVGVACGFDVLGLG